MDKLIRVNLGRNLQALRMKAGLSRADLAKKASLSRMTIWRVETGNSPIGDPIGAIATALGVSPDLLLRPHEEEGGANRRSA